MSSSNGTYALRLASALIALALLGIAPATELPAPDTVWPMYQFAANRNAVFSGPLLPAPWKLRVGRVNGGLASVGKSLYLDTLAGDLIAIDRSAGTIRWRVRFSNAMMDASVVAGGLVVVGTGANPFMAGPRFVMGRPEGDEIEAVSADSGQLQWRFHTDGENMATGVYAVVGRRATFLFSNGDNHVYALDFSTGRLRWRENTLGINAMSDLALFDGQVYGIAEYRWQRLFDNEAVSEKTPWAWTWSLDPHARFFNWRQPYGVADGGVTVGQKAVFLQSVQLIAPKGRAAVERSHQIGWQRLLDEATWSTNVIALDRSSGRTLWRYDDTPGLRPAVTSGTFSTAGTLVGDTLYEALQISRHLAAFDARTGALRWKTATDGPVKMSPVLQGGFLFAGDTDGTMYVIDQDTGRIVRRIRFPGRFSPAPPIVVGNALFVVNGEMLYALRISDLEDGRIGI